MLKWLGGLAEPVVLGDEQQHLGAGGARGFELLDGHQVVLVGSREHLDRHTAGQGDRLRIGGPVRRRKEHLVARIEQCGEGLVHGLLAAVGDDHLRRVHLEGGVAQRLGGDRLAQLGQTCRGRVAVVLGVACGGDGRIDDVLGRGEGRFTRREADHGPTGGLELLGLGVDLEGRGLGDGSDAVRNALHEAQPTRLGLVGGSGAGASYPQATPAPWFPALVWISRAPHRRGSGGGVRSAARCRRSGDRG